MARSFGHPSSECMAQDYINKVQNVIELKYIIQIIHLITIKKWKRARIQRN